VILELEEAGAERVRFRALVYTPDSLYRGEASVAHPDGQVELGGWDREPPAWLAEHARRFLRTEWRARQGPDAPPWPARISRWRAER
jgi:hypothetical protein